MHVDEFFFISLPGSNFGIDLRAMAALSINLLFQILILQYMTHRIGSETSKGLDPPHHLDCSNDNNCPAIDMHQYQHPYNYNLSIIANEIRNGTGFFVLKVLGPFANDVRLGNCAYKFSREFLFEILRKICKRKFLLNDTKNLKNPKIVAYIIKHI